MTLQWLLGWWNLLFLIPLLLALVYIGVYAVSGVTFGDADAVGGHDVGDGHDAGDAHDADAGDHDHDFGDGEADGDAHDADGHDAEAHDGEAHEGEAGGARFALFDIVAAVIGLGRAPLSILLMVLFLTWGFLGLMTNSLLYEKTRPTAMQVAGTSVLVALLGSVALTRLVAGALGKVLAAPTRAARRHDLLGCTGRAVFPIDESYGVASVRDENHDLFQVPCRVRPGEPALTKDTPVKLVGYNMKQQIYLVVACPDAAAKPQAPTQTRA